MTIDVRPAIRREHKVLADVLSRAFFDDPVQQWLVPDARHRYARLKRFFRVELDARGAADALRLLAPGDSLVRATTAAGGWS